MDDIPCKLIWQWIPGHSNVPGNELADAAAKDATVVQGMSRPVSYNSSIPLVNRCIPYRPPTHQRTAQVYSKISQTKEATITTRESQVYLARLRSGHHLGLAETRNRYNPEKDPSCLRCGAENETLEHWLLHCAGTLAARMKIFGTTKVELSMLTEFPKKAIALAQRTLCGAALQ